VDSSLISERLSPKRLQQLLTDLPSGREELLSLLVEFYRPYLLAIARVRLDDRLKAKAGPSDLAQETLLAAHREWEQLADRPKTEEELRKWLRGILMERLKALRRRFYRAQRRSLVREQSLDVGDSRQLLDQIGESFSETPSVHLDRKIESERLELALQRLSPVYRQVIIWRNHDDWSFADIGQRIDRSADAARMLWGRAIRQLKKELGA
jgi:RNA polymerase sigma-70 factor, ECF subfamily